MVIDGIGNVRIRAFDIDTWKDAGFLGSTNDLINIKFRRLTAVGDARIFRTINSWIVIGFLRSSKSAMFALLMNPITMVHYVSLCLS